MSYTRTETLTTTLDLTSHHKKAKPKSTGFFHTKTAPGAPGPTPPSKTVTTHDDNHGCCFPFKRKCC